MTILADFQIAQLCKNTDRPMLSPFRDQQVKTIESILNEKQIVAYRAGLLTRQGKFLDPIDLNSDKTVPNVRLEGEQFILTQRAVSSGLSSYGYDAVLGNQFKLFKNTGQSIVDPLDMPTGIYEEITTDRLIIPPNSYALGHTVEVFDMPDDVLAICMGKSTLARAGVSVTITPIEPGFRGNVVVEVANLTPLPVAIHANQGIAQFLFFRGEPCEVSYSDRGGKYMHQTGVTTARV